MVQAATPSALESRNARGGDPEPPPPPLGFRAAEEEEEVGGGRIALSHRLVETQGRFLLDSWSRTGHQKPWDTEGRGGYRAV